ncbi:MAG: hypothetical protein FJ403_21790 [Verrucomicrobia bacterium]|nr:hypothetical protein [Verrucomicrobiota bacterium]
MSDFKAWCTAELFRRCSTKLWLGLVALARVGFGYCAELNVRFVRPLSLGQEVIATAELISNRRDKLFEVRGEIRDEAGTALATATGKHLALKDEEAKLLMSDLEGDPAEVVKKLNG